MLLVKPFYNVDAQCALPLSNHIDRSLYNVDAGGQTFWGIALTTNMYTRCTITIAKFLC